ncbi:uncharacterized protein LOC111240918 [Vigna radiata var. radiata]|uniref:Uncharacterized protein LOC111240918 n=1 Tax=Vigna radiata var. radiata TaxID=3916 RepID=A0A3Q0ENP2_VIGRR|nr:uncharacterized protein LOC111240918 [Vigna radiata var. radiata]
MRTPSSRGRERFLLRGSSPRRACPPHQPWCHRCCWPSVTTSMASFLLRRRAGKPLSLFRSISTSQSSTKSSPPKRKKSSPLNPPVTATVSRQQRKSFPPLRIRGGRHQRAVVSTHTICRLGKNGLWVTNGLEIRLGVGLFDTVLVRLALFDAGERGVWHGYDWFDSSVLC